MGTTFAVDDVEPCRLHIETPASEVVEKLAVRTLHHGAERPPGWLQAWGCGVERLMLSHHHPLAMAAYVAFDNHFPLSLSPDHIWTVVVQGLARHIRRDPERYRSRLVEHEGREELVVRRDDFVLESRDNDWAGAIDEMSGQIREHIGEHRHRLLVPTFSTTGALERLVAQIGLMDTVSSYFEYSFATLCGIPSITLEGTPEDWSQLRRRVEVLAEFEMEWWSEVLAGVLASFEAAARGEVDRAFWSSMVKARNMSGGPYLTGWLAWLFPYLEVVQLEGGLEYERNPALGRMDEEISLPSLPGGQSVVESNWRYLGRTLPMRLMGGFVGLGQTSEGGLRPELGWMLVRHVENDT
jgi:hypothetical protein